MKHSGRVIRLIDTPGFNDSELDDSEILRVISMWLSAVYNHTPQLLLSGLIFLHPISEVRMRGSDKDNLAMFQALCSSNEAHQLSCVVIGTTMWSKVDRSVGEARQAELSEKSWKDLIGLGASVVEHSNTRASALALLDRIIAQDKRLKLNIQVELSAGVELQDTDVGRTMSRKLHQVQKEADQAVAETAVELEAAERLKDEQTVNELTAMRLEYEKEKLAAQRDMENLRVDMETLFRLRMDEMRREETVAAAGRARDEQDRSTLVQTLSSLSKYRKALSADAEKPLDVDKLDLLIKDQTVAIQKRTAEHESKVELQEAKRHKEVLRATNVGTAVGAVAATVAVAEIASEIAKGCNPS